MIIHYYYVSQQKKKENKQTQNRFLKYTNITCIINKKEETLEIISCS